MKLRVFGPLDVDAPEKTLVCRRTSVDNLPEPACQHHGPVMNYLYCSLHFSPLPFAFVLLCVFPLTFSLLQLKACCCFNQPLQVLLVIKCKGSANLNAVSLGLEAGGVLEAPEISRRKCEFCHVGTMTKWYHHDVSGSEWAEI